MKENMISMIKKIQVLWYLTKDDFENYCLDFKIYNNHQIEGYEVCDVDEDLIYDLCDKNPDVYEPLGYFKNLKEIENHLKDNNIEATVEFSEEDYYIAIKNDSVVVKSWYEPLKKEYSTNSDLWISEITGYDIYDLAPTGKTLSYVLGDILNVNESYFDDIILNKGRIEKEEWNEILDKVYKRNKINLGLRRVI